MGHPVDTTITRPTRRTGSPRPSAALMDLTKDTIRSDSTDAQEAMGVIDPLDAKVTTLEGRGKRITLRDASEKVLADIIIGNEIKGSRAQGGRGHALRPCARPETDLRREHQGRAIHPVCRLDRDQPAQGRSHQDPPRGLRQLQDPGRSQRAGPPGPAARREIDDYAQGRDGSVGDGRLARGTGAGRGQAPRPDRRAGRPQDRGRPAASRRDSRNSTRKTSS